MLALRPVHGRLPWRRALPLAALLAATGLVFANGLTGAFVLDDRPLVQGYSCAREPLESLDGLLLIGSGPCAYRPLRYLTYALDHALHGENPLGYHATNLLLHLLTVTAVFLLLRRVLRGTLGEDDAATGSADFGALAGAAVFALHPVQVDSVTYIAGRRDVLHALLYLGAVLAWLRYRATERKAWAAAVVSLYYLALQSKEMAITLPAALLLVDAAMERLAATGELPAPVRGPGDVVRLLGRAVLHYLRPLRRRPWLFAVLFAMGIGFFFFRGVAAPVTHHPGFWGGSRLANTATALGTLPGYARLVLWPAELMIDYSPDAYPIQSGFGAALPLGGLAILLALAGVALGLLERRPRLALAAGWVLVALLPVMHLVPHHELMAEHYLYLPLVGVGLAIGVGLAWVHRRSRLVAPALLVALLLPLALRTMSRNLDFADEWRLWEAEFAVTDDCARAHASYAALLWANPERDTPERTGLERHLRRALEIQDRSIAGVTRFPYEETAARLGAVEVWRGRVDAGLERLRWAWETVRRRGLQREEPGVAETYVVTLMNLGGAGGDDGRRALLREAETAATEWLTFAADPVAVRFLRGRARHVLCRLTEARSDFAVVLDGPDRPRRIEAAELLVESFVEEGDLVGAQAALDEAKRRKLASPKLAAFERALASGAPPPAPRCPGAS
jgi:hypothetical protein